MTLRSIALAGILVTALTGCSTGSGSGGLQQRWDSASADLARATDAYMQLSQETVAQDAALLPVMEEMLERSEPLLVDLETAFADWNAVTEQVLEEGSLNTAEAHDARDAQASTAAWLSDLQDQQRLGGECVRSAGGDENRFWPCWADMMSTHGGEWAANVERVRSAWSAAGAGS